MLNSGAGEASFLWSVVLDTEGLSLRAFATDDRVMGGFSPGGTHFVAMPHGGDAVSIHRWPDGAEIDRLQANHIFLLDDDQETVDSFGYRAVFLDDQHIVADTRQGRLLLLAITPLRIEAELWPEGTVIRAYGDRGQPVIDPHDVVDYEGDLVDWLVVEDKLLTEHVCSPDTRERLSLWNLAHSV